MNDYKFYMVIDTDRSELMIMGELNSGMQAHGVQRNFDAYFDAALIRIFVYYLRKLPDFN
jgi:hypothetical protein